MIGVLVGVNQVPNRLVGYLADRLQIIRSECRRRVHGDDTIAGHQEHRVIRSIGDPVQAAPYLFARVPLRLGRERTDPDNEPEETKPLSGDHASARPKRLSGDDR